MEVTESRFSHERAGLEYVRALFPDHEPYRAWSNLEIITDRGRSLEVDLLVLGPAGLNAIELKAWSGRLTGDRYTWRIQRDRTNTITNPWRLANEKAKVLKSMLLEAARRHAEDLPEPVNGRRVVPFVQAAVFLHSPEIRCELAAEERNYLFGLEGETERTGLPGIVTGLISRQPRNPDRAVTTAMAEAVTMLLTNKLRVAQRRGRRVGPFDLEDKVFSEGQGWQDFLATHRRFPDSPSGFASITPAGRRRPRSARYSSARRSASTA